METRIGEVFREARRRREVDLAEVEAATRIRPRYLRAIEEEEWGALPGGFYTRGFIRTYAAFLGLDGDRLAEEYRENVEGASREWTPAAEPGPAGEAPRGRGRLRGGRGVPAAGWVAAIAIAGIAAVVIVALPDGGGESGPEPGSNARSAPRPPGASHLAKNDRPSRAGVSIRLAASAEVWVCIIDDGGRALVDGQILEGGAQAGPFRSDSFTVSFGNGEISMQIDGKEAQIPPTSSPIGYSIEPSGELTELSEVERPTCT
ncbi:MAG TPA: helix-turn-helix domain-containing protein [Solirubrobacterales bacterium]|nr:helix-turn-helix domain-containing protein [Solirubrobacterales bacterium]